MDASPLHTTRHTSALALLDKLAVGIVALCLSLRGMGGGLTPDELEGAWLGVFIAMAFVFRLTRLCLDGHLSLPRHAVWFGLPLFAGAVLLSWRAGLETGAGAISSDLAMMWLLDGLLFCLVADTARSPGVLRLYATCLLAGLCLSGVYGLYQRVYGLPYFRTLFRIDPALQALTATHDADTALDFRARLTSDRIFGTFAYPNAVAGYALLLLPLLGWVHPPAGSSKRRGIGWRWVPVLLGCILIVYARSKAGLLTAKLAEPVALWLLLPEASRNWRAFGGLAGRVIWMTLGSALAAGVAYHLAGGDAAGLRVADTVFALCWTAELLWLGACAQAGRPPRLGGTPKGVLDACGLLLVLMTLTGGILLLHLPAERLPRDAQRLQTQAELAIRVRREFGIAGVTMFRDHPWRGVGLDQFQTRYPYYKTPQGWETRRAHNLYIQLAADGGLPLLASFLLVAALLLLPPRCLGMPDTIAPPDTPDTPGTPGTSGMPLALPASQPPSSPLTAPEVDAFCHRFAPWVGVGALALTYLFFLSGMAGGLSLEFFIKELLGGAGSIRTETGSWFPLFVHGAVHLLLLPVTLWMTARWIWSRTENRTGAAAVPWIALGLGAVLVHSLFDFHYHTEVIHMIWWTLAGMLVAGSSRGSYRWIVRPVARGGLAAAVLLVGTVATLGFPLRRLQGLETARAAKAAVEQYTRTPANRRTEARQRQVEALLDEATQRRPGDSRLRRARVTLLHDALEETIRHSLPTHLPPAAYLRQRRMRLVAPPAALAEARASLLARLEQDIEQSPWSSAARVDLAHALLDLHPDDPASRSRAIDLYAEAIALYPTQARYHAQRARLLQEAGRMEEARADAARALALDEAGTDRRTALQDADRVALQTLVTAPR